MKYVEFCFPGLTKVRAVFTGRSPEAGDVDAQGNISFTMGHDREAVLGNRRRLARELGFTGWHSLRQVHGDRVVFNPEESTLEAPSTVEADGSGTDAIGRALVVKTADCQPILLAHVGGGHICALHCGWRGNRMGFPTSGVAAFCERYGLEPADLLAVRGPSLSPSASQFVNFDTEFGPEFEDYFNPKRKTVDLWQLTADQLVRAGLRPENIYGLDVCTFEDEGYFSHRRDKASGRQAALIWIEG